MKFLAIEKDLVNQTPSNYNEILKDEAKHVWELQKREVLREIYFTENRNAVLILECVDINEVNSVLSQMPLSKNKLVEFDIKQLNPYSGLERLFE